MDLKLKTLVTGDEADRLLLPGTVYELEVLPEGNCLYQKIKIDKSFPVKFYYRKLRNIIPRTDPYKPPPDGKFGDLIIYISKFATQDRRPGPDYYDYSMRSKTLFIDFTKEYAYLNRGIIHLAFSS